ncbi:MAG: hypothetical protein E7603_10620 [Ruminococcaceae bacterium]|nr:hypothetical protein [Oscillospiraceae bacterium]
MNFKKTLAFMLALCTCALLLCSCNNQTDEIPEGMQLITSEYLDSKFFVPKEWTPEITTGTLVAKASDNSNVSIQKMATSGSYASADEYFRTDYFPKLTSTFKNVVLLEEECSTENQKFGSIGNYAVKYVYTVESDGSVYKIMQYFSVYSGYLYIMTYTAEQSLFSEHLEEVTDIVNCFVY